jgi:hypothetical protein
VIRVLGFLSSWWTWTAIFSAIVTFAGFNTAIRNANTGGAVLWAVLFVLVVGWLVALWKRRTGFR